MEKGYTPLAMEAVSESGAKSVSFDEAEEQMEKLSGLFVSSTTIRALTYVEAGEVQRRQRQEAETAKAPEVLDERDAALDEPPPEKVALSQDGTHIRTYDDWREVKISTSSIIEVEPAASAEEAPKVQQKEHSYRAGIWTSEELRWQHWADAMARGLDRAEEIIALGDGAAWIWENFAHCFPDRTEILDWPHAERRIWEAAHAVYGEDSSEAKEWVPEQLKDLDKGEAENVGSAVRDLDPPNDEAEEVIRLVGQYFETHAHRMRYEDFREAGYPIGSGTVESAARHLVEARMKRSGQRWAVPNANGLLALRAELSSTASPMAN